MIVLHEPTGAPRAYFPATTGGYNIAELRPGGPYEIRVSYIGYQAAVRRGVTLAMGQNLRVDFRLRGDVIQAEAVVVTAQGDEVFNASNTDTETHVTANEIARLPAIAIRRLFWRFRGRTHQRGDPHRHEPVPRFSVLVRPQRIPGGSPGRLRIRRFQRLPAGFPPWWTAGREPGFLLHQRRTAAARESFGRRPADSGQPIRFGADSAALRQILDLAGTNTVTLPGNSIPSRRIHGT